MWEITGVIITILALIISVAALVVSVVAVIVSIVFYFKSAKALQHTTDVLGGYLEATVKDGSIKFKKDKKGHFVSLIYSAPLTGNQATGTVGVVLPGVKEDKKPD